MLHYYMYYVYSNKNNLPLKIIFIYRIGYQIYARARKDNNLSEIKMIILYTKYACNN